MSKRKQRQPARGWLLWATVQDSPASEEEYLNETQLLDLLQHTLSVYEGLKLTRLRLQPLPRTAKASRSEPNKP